MVCSIKYFDHFYWLVFLWLSFVSSEYNQDIGPLSTIWFINYMILSVYSLFFILLKMSFWKAKIFSLIKSSLSVHSFLVHAFDEKSEKSLSRSKVINLLGWRTGFMEDNVSMDLGVGMVQDDSSTLQVLCALFLFPWVPEILTWYPQWPCVRCTPLGPHQQPASVPGPALCHSRCCPHRDQHFGHHHLLAPSTVLVSTVAPFAEVTVLLAASPHKKQETEENKTILGYQSALSFKSSKSEFLGYKESKTPPQEGGL